jgi:phosphoglycolate phosphatase
MNRFKLVIFDLDGTLLNTIEDLAYSANYALKELGYPTHPVEDYNFFVGNGVRKLFERALPENEKTAENIERVREIFMPYYDKHNADYTKPYDGMSELLAEIQKEGYKIAVASNKYQTATEKLVSKYFPDIDFTAVFGQRDKVPVKPDPSIVFDISKIAGVSPEEILYVGDSGVDMQTASKSGVISAGVTWGFRPVSELEENNANLIVDRADEILKILHCQNLFLGY